VLRALSDSRTLAAPILKLYRFPMNDRVRFLGMP
jgi:hypothetical protein